jgi:diacylglycerol kinase (ATP)
MRKAALLYNPDSGGSQQRRRELESALAVLRAGGVEADLVPTESRNHGEEETRRALDAGCDTIFACGGDGTIHNIVQVLVNSPAALGILPMGTANALAHDIGLPLGVVAAAKAALRCTPRRVTLGRVTYADLQGHPAARYFVVTAGIGVDAHLFYKLHSGTKQRMGMAAYYAKAWNLWFTYVMPRFVAEYSETGSSALHRAEVTELLAVRIRNFGGVVRELAPGASLDRDDNRLVLCRSASRLVYLAYVTRGLLRARWAIPGVDLVYSTRVSCQYQTSSVTPSATSSATPSASPQGQGKIYIEADGELLGTLPAEITAVPDALTLLAPPR